MLQGEGLKDPARHLHRQVGQILPTNTCPQIAASLYVAQCTVKTHLRAIYQKLGVASRSEALERALDLGLL